MHLKMPGHLFPGCTVMVTNIPCDMDLRSLRDEMSSYGTIERWAVLPGPVQVYAVYKSADMANAAVLGLREHRRLVVKPVSV